MASSNKNKKSLQDVYQEKSERMMEGVAYWASFYRKNPQRFVKEYLNMRLKLFQKILIYCMINNYYFMYIASRGSGGHKNILTDKTPVKSEMVFIKLRN